MTDTVSKADRKAANVAAHQARNAQAKADAQVRRAQRRDEGLNRAAKHNLDLTMGAVGRLWDRVAQHEQRNAAIAAAAAERKAQPVAANDDQALPLAA